MSDAAEQRAKYYKSCCDALIEEKSKLSSQLSEVINGIEHAAGMGYSECIIKLREIIKEHK